MAQQLKFTLVAAYVGLLALVFCHITISCEGRDTLRKRKEEASVSEEVERAPDTKGALGNNSELVVVPKASQEDDPDDLREDVATSSVGKRKPEDQVAEEKVPTADIEKKAESDVEKQLRRIVEMAQKIGDILFELAMIEDNIYKGTSPEEMEKVVKRADELRNMLLPIIEEMEELNQQHEDLKQSVEQETANDAEKKEKGIEDLKLLEAMGSIIAKDISVDLQGLFQYIEMYQKYNGGAKHQALENAADVSKPESGVVEASAGSDTEDIFSFPWDQYEDLLKEDEEILIQPQEEGKGDTKNETVRLRKPFAAFDFVGVLKSVQKAVAEADVDETLKKAQDALGEPKLKETLETWQKKIAEIDTADKGLQTAQEAADEGIKAAREALPDE